MTSSASSSPSRKVLSKIACLRLQKELGEWQASPPGGFTYKIAWVIEVSGAEGTLYAGETYRPQVDFPEQYPMEAPQRVVVELR
ncbi:probable ubiquitin-conjugating enzyme E2 18 [Triticum aestivum]|uniref:probable ubiquitin-conjugating enzyme E2 18 n=1 Tax=Triticum aestivum TaxID=4565 RepID=UPI001D02DAB9|nr:probable ubiquitin-conjugating enzyme E2 18 [Triticum aestivum]